MSNKTFTDMPPIEVDEILSPIVPEFLEKRRRDCELIRNLLAKGDFNEIRVIGHRMKGAGGSYGFDEVSEIGERMELASLTADEQTIQAEMERLSNYLKQVKVIYV
jgi:HPt (histidine-containing phosphotransfer) domain-containing protein